MIIKKNAPAVFFDEQWQNDALHPVHGSILFYFDTPTAQTRNFSRQEQTRSFFCPVLWQCQQREYQFVSPQKFFSRNSLAAFRRQPKRHSAKATLDFWQLTFDAIDSEVWQLVSTCFIRRSITSARQSTSLCPLTVRIVKWRYSFLSGIPFIKTTIDPTLPADPKLEISYPSMRPYSAAVPCVRGSWTNDALSKAISWMRCNGKRL